MYFQALNNKKLRTHRRLRLAVLGGHGSAYLRACVCAAAVRRGLIVSSLSATYGLYNEMLMDDESPLYAFRPDAVLLAVDPGQLCKGFSHAKGSSGIAKQHLGASLIQRTILAHIPNEIDDSVAQTKSSLLNTMQAHLGAGLDKQQVRLSYSEEKSESSVLVSWSEPAIWGHKKQNFHPRSDLLHGNHLGRLLAAVRGISYNCLMLDISGQSNLAIGYDLASFTTARYRAVVQDETQGGSLAKLDLFLLLDEDPFGYKTSSRNKAIYTMPRPRQDGYDG